MSLIYVPTQTLLMASLSTPEMKPHYSFQHSLERYLAFAKKHKMQPVLLTGTARAKTVDAEYGAPIPSIATHY